MKEKDSVKDI